MPEIAFLLGDVTLARHDHHERLPAAFRRADWKVTCIDQEAVRLEAAGVRLGEHDPAAFDLIWLLGLGRASTFFDRMQLLHGLPQQRLVTPVDALVYWHAKYAWWRHMPETHASSDPAYLKDRLASGGEWVVKPTAGSFGRDVQRIRADAEGAAAIDRLTAHGSRFCLLQRFVAEIEHGEKRTLVADGRLIGTYLRLPGADLRANLAEGGTAAPADLTREERTLVQSLATELAARGIGFAAIDTVFPYLMEINLANPGGLPTLAALYGREYADDVVAALAARQRRH